MKIVIPFLVIVLLSALFPSCSKNTLSFHKYDTLRLAATKDATIFYGDGEGGGYYDNASGASDLLRVGYSDDLYYIARTLIAFDVSSVPANAVMVNATLSFTVGQSGNNTNLIPVSIYSLTRDWTEGTSEDGCVYANNHCSQPGTSIATGVTWNDALTGVTPWTTGGGDFVSSPSATIPGGGDPRFSSQGIMLDVKAWMAAPSSNFGWLLMVDENALTGNGGEMNRYYSREASTQKISREDPFVDNGASPMTKPTLTIVYYK